MQRVQQNYYKLAARRFSGEGGDYDTERRQNRAVKSLQCAGVINPPRRKFQQRDYLVITFTCSQLENCGAKQNERSAIALTHLIILDYD